MTIFSNLLTSRNRIGIAVIVVVTALVTLVAQSILMPPPLCVEKQNGVNPEVINIHTDPIKNEVVEDVKPLVPLAPTIAKNPVVETTTTTKVVNNPRAVQGRSVGMGPIPTPAPKPLNKNEDFALLKTLSGKSFYFAKEDVMHSADYILQNERSERSWFEDRVREAPFPNCNVVDIGCNGGFYALTALTLGCKVLAVDAQPRCLYRLNSSSIINGYSDSLEMRWAAVSDDPNLEIEVGATRCSGLWSAKGSDWINAESDHNVRVKSAPLATLLDSWIPDVVVHVMKIDAEGSELAILRSALPYFERRAIKHVVAEISPGRVAKMGYSKADWDDVFSRLYASGYQVKMHSSSSFDNLESVKGVYDGRRDSPDVWFISLMK